MKLRRSSRQRADREVFAPNKYEKNMPYELNEKRAMTKKIEATSRESDVKIEHQRLSRACIVHLVIKKTNWSYVKTMSCVILELRST